MSATTASRAAANSAELVQLLHRANGDALQQQFFGSVLPGWRRSWALPAGVGLAAAPLAGLAAALLTGSLGVGLLCGSLAAGIAATGAWLLAHVALPAEPEFHAAESAWTDARIFDDLYDN